MHKYIELCYGLEGDEQCQDISRLCYCSYDPSAYFNANSEVFNEVFQKPEPEPQPRPVVQPAYWTTDAPADSPSLRWAIRALESAVFGTKNATRIRVGRLIGGLIAGGQLDPSAADTIADVAAANSNHPRQARKQVLYAIERYGKSSPIYPDHHTRHWQVNGSRNLKTYKLRSWRTARG
jgi:hypothetical protein